MNKNQFILVILKKSLKELIVIKEDVMIYYVGVNVGVK